jgi:hypothetical protein
VPDRGSQGLDRFCQPQQLGIDPLLLAVIVVLLDPLGNSGVHLLQGCRRDRAVFLHQADDVGDLLGKGQGHRLLFFAPGVVALFQLSLRPAPEPLGDDIERAEPAHDHREERHHLLEGEALVHGGTPVPVSD